MSTISDTPITPLTLSSLYTSPSPIVITTVQGVLFLNLQMRKQKGQSQDSHYSGMDLVQNPVFCLQSPDAGCPETFMSLVPRGQAGEAQPNQRSSHVRMSLSPKCYVEAHKPWHQQCGQAPTTQKMSPKPINYLRHEGTPLMRREDVICSCGFLTWLHIRITYRACFFFFFLAMPSSLQDFKFPNQGIKPELPAWSLNHQGSSRACSL